MKSFDDIEIMILKHIKHIDDLIIKMETAKGVNYNPKSYEELLKAKSTALQALVGLKDSKDGRR